MSTGIPPVEGDSSSRFVSEYSQEWLVGEHDACGVGVRASKDGVPSHEILEEGLENVSSLQHRSGTNADGKSGDGTGVQTQVPQKLFKEEIGVSEDSPDLGVGMIFLPQDEGKRSDCKEIMRKYLEARGHKLHWRDVPTNQDVVGEIAGETQPHIEQAVIERREGLSDEEFERELYLVRRLIEKEVTDQDLSSPGPDTFSFSSMSCRSIVYKGMVTAKNFPKFFKDFQDERFETNYIIFHTRFSTNTNPLWHLAQPFDHVAHNGEINTIKGNLRWAAVHEQLLRGAYEPSLAGLNAGLPEEAHIKYDDLLPIVPEGLSDSGVVNAIMQLYLHAGFSPDFINTMMTPEAFQLRPHLSAEENEKLRQAYEYFATIMEPFDGPAFLVMSDGRKVALGLDRNGLRPSTETITIDGQIHAASESVRAISPEEKVYNDSLSGGGITLYDLEHGQVMHGDEVLLALADQFDFAGHVARVKSLGAEVEAQEGHFIEEQTDLTRRQRLAGWYYEDLKLLLDPSVKEGEAPMVSMGDDAQLVYRSKVYRRLSAYFRHKFAQVTNPAIDVYREGHVFDMNTYLGSHFTPDGEQKGVLQDGEDPDIVKLDSPVVSNSQFKELEEKFGNNVVRIDCTFDASGGEESLRAALEDIARQAEMAARQGKHIILHDMAADLEKAGIPIWLAIGKVHSHLIKKGLRHATSINVRSAEMIEGHDCAMAIGAGADTVNAYLAEETIAHRLAAGEYNDPDNPAAPPPTLEELTQKYHKAMHMGVMKIMAKMGITTLSSFRGGCIFEAQGLSKDVAKEFFNSMPSPISGHGLGHIADRVQGHQEKISKDPDQEHLIENPGIYGWTTGGVPHGLDPTAVKLLRDASLSADRDVMGKSLRAAIEVAGVEEDEGEGLQAAYRAIEETADKVAEEKRKEKIREIVKFARERAYQKALKEGADEEEAGEKADTEGLRILPMAAAMAARKNDYEKLALKRAVKEHFDQIYTGGGGDDLFEGVLGRAYDLHHTGGYKRFKDFTAHIYGATDIDAETGEEIPIYDPFSPIEDGVHLRDAWRIKKEREKTAIDLDDVEDGANVRSRFSVADMSVGALSNVSHSALAEGARIAGAKSRSGEGGLPKDGSHVGTDFHQLASGRFGADLDFMADCERITLKIAQGAKPGKGGQLPGFKVTEFIAQLRNTEPGTSLISPPPHHDMYSIEDLQELIYTLKKVNPKALVEVKLVSSDGVDVVGAGVAKAEADAIITSGHNGGTAASPLGSVQHAGQSWEMGLSALHQTLTEQGLRDGVILSTDGGLKSARDIVVAALLGAEEFGIGTAALVSMGCLYVKQCHTDTCPVGIATQDPELIDKFPGRPEDIANYLTHLGEEVREILAEMGYESLEEIIGRTDLLEDVLDKEQHDIDVSDFIPDEPTPLNRKGPHKRKEVLANIDDYILQQNENLFGDDGKIHITNTDVTDASGKIIAHLSQDDDGSLIIEADVTNEDRALGTRMSGEIFRKTKKLKDEFGGAAAYQAVKYKLKGIGGNSLGSWLHESVSIELTGEANDYIGRGQSGGVIIVKSEEGHASNAETSLIANNVIGFGQIGGLQYFDGKGHDRMAIRKSGGGTIAETCNVNGFNYVTGGWSILLSAPGQNYGAGSTGGLEYIYATEEELGNVMHKGKATRQHEAMSEEKHAAHLAFIRANLTDYFNRTGNAKAERILSDWENEKKNFRVAWAADKEAAPETYLDLAA